MCIICYKPQNVEMVDMKYLENCELFNKDGAGFMVKLGNQVVIKKGFFDVPTLYDEIFKTCNEHPEKYDIGVHFRFATHGVIDRGNCHPFSISKRASKLRNIEVTTNYALMHNGIITGMPKEKILSDTQVFIRNNYEMLQSNPAKILNKTDGKFLYFSSRNIIKKGLTEDMGWYWSNDGYQDFTGKYYNHSFGGKSYYKEYYDEYDYYDNFDSEMTKNYNNTTFESLSELFEAEMSDERYCRMVEWAEMSDGDFIDAYINAYDNRKKSNKHAEIYRDIQKMADRIQYDIDG